MYILCNGTCYDQMVGVTMESPLASVMANFYMECFKQMPPSTVLQKPAYWYRFVDDTFMVKKN